MAEKKKSDPEKKVSKRQKRIRRLRRIALFCVLPFVAVYLITLYIVPWFFEIPPGLTEPPKTGLEFTDRNDQPMRRLLSNGQHSDRPVTFEEIPQRLIDATLAAEDTRFFSHNGIDYFGVARAIRDAVIHREFVSGASTVTQQLAKVTSEPRPREIRTKIIEAFTARRLEMTYSKEEILAEYLSRIPYGNQLHGCRAAARGYFGKPLADLSIAESAFLAGLPNKPTRFNPYRNFRGARARQVWILNRLLIEGWISDEEFETAVNEKLVIQPRGSHAFHAPHFLDLVLERKVPQTAGMKFSSHGVKTTLDLELQHFVEETVDSKLSMLGDDEDGSSDAFQAAVVVIENQSGDVLALTGSRDFFNSRGGQINGAWVPRSAGSALKPFTYLLALENGHTAASIIPDLPIEFTTATGNYRPVNYDRRYYGPVSLRHALANSLNVPAVRMLDKIGGAKPLHHLLTEKLELTGLNNNPDHYGLGLTIGNAEVRLLELTNAYATLARMGEHLPVKLLSNSMNQQGMFSKPTLFDREAAWIIADILSDNAARAAAFGFNSPLHFPYRVAAKTGTSTDYRDNWTFGFTPEFTVGVWVGRFDNEPVQNVSGISGAGPVFHDVMTRLHQKIQPTWYEKPSRLVEAEVDSLSGKRINESLDFRPKRTHLEFFRPEFLPTRAREDEFDESGKTRLAQQFEEWFKSYGAFLNAIAVVGEESKTSKTQTLEIVSPISGTVAFLDPDLPDSGKYFPLEVKSKKPVQWESPSLKIQKREGGDWLILEAGEHTLIATDENGSEARSILRVEAL